MAKEYIKTYKDVCIFMKNGQKVVADVVWFDLLDEDDDKYAEEYITKIDGKVIYVEPECPNIENIDFSEVEG